MTTTPTIDQGEEQMDDTIVNRFWRDVEKRGPDDCWEWRGNRRPRGYGFFYRAGKRVNATHLALALAGQPRPAPDLFACHHCDNPPCVNPRHLRWATKAANTVDMTMRRRHGNTKRVECKHGHAFDEANTRWTKRGQRDCRACARIRSAAVRAAKAAQR